MFTRQAMNDHLPTSITHGGHMVEHENVDPVHAETTEVLLSLLSQNKALGGKNASDVNEFSFTLLQ